MRYRDSKDKHQAFNLVEGAGYWGEAGRAIDGHAHVLVIDDAVDEIQPVVALLHQHRLRLTVASDGWRGYQHALALMPDLILLDVRMPHMDGFAVCRLLKESSVTRHIPVIFLSCADAPDERLEGLAHGGVDYITKPCVPVEVFVRVCIHLNLRLPASQEEAGGDAQLTHDEVLLRAAMRFIREHLEALPTLDDIAHQVGAYDKKLSAIFRQYCGTTVFAWIREERLHRARKLLTDTRLSIQDIAMQVGFNSACNFITAFRERMGVTPSQFRKVALHGADGQAR
jgi:AraC-like DNA-binding protein